MEEKTIKQLKEEIQILKEQVKELKQNENSRFRMILEDMQLIGIILDSDARLMYVNKFFLDLTGWKKEDALNTNWFDNFIPGEIDESIRILFKKSLLSNDMAASNTNEIITRNGTKLMIRWNFITQFDDQQNPVSMTCIGEDVSDKIKAEEALKESENNYRFLIENQNELLLKFDADGKFTFATHTFYKTTGRSPEDVIGKRFEDVALAQNSETISRLYPALKEPPHIIYAEYETVTLEGLRWYGWSVKSILDENNEIIGTIAVGRDIHLQKIAEQELIKAKEAAEKSDRLKSAFLANLSHEIRTPMNGILGFTGLLKRENLSGEKQNEFIDNIFNSGERMLNTVNNIIEISRLETGQVQPTLITMDLQKIIDELVQQYTPLARQKGLYFNLNLDDALDKAHICADKMMLLSILNNAIKNAIKYSSEGGLEFGARKIEYRGKPGIEFFVSDTGIGLSEEHLTAVFDRFFRVEIHDENAVDGTGLGLSITKEYVKLLNGEIWIESTIGTGSTLHIQLPGIDCTEEDKKQLGIPSSSKKEIPKLNILIVEDDENSNVYLQILVDPFAKVLMHAPDGKSAVEIVKKNSDLDLILMDIRMPEMNGHDATRHIRQFNKDIKIIAQTAYSMVGDREKAILSGCNEYITKPIEEKKLQELISRLFS